MGNLMYIVPIAGIVALISAYFFYNSMMRSGKRKRKNGRDRQLCQRGSLRLSL